MLLNLIERASQPRQPDPLQIPMVDLRAMHIVWGDKLNKSVATYQGLSNMCEWYTASRLNEDPHYLCHHERCICYRKPQMAM